jgi:hypothetical protein
MSDEKKPFTVTDRRLFDSEGRIREGDAPAAAEAEAGTVPASGSGSAAQPATEARSEAGTPGDRDTEDAGADQRPLQFPADLSGLLLSLATQATLLMSPAAQDEAGEPGADLEAARSVITLIEVLRDKTHGNRTPEEDRLLQTLLYELRMAYVAAARTAGT